MLDPNASDSSVFSGKVRVRACGLLEEQNKILLIKHLSIGPLGYLWIPPGGGVNFGESAEDAVEREFMEETGLEVKVDQFLFTFEIINEKHHAIELFYKVKKVGGQLQLGSDPELSSENQIMEKLNFFSSQELDDMEDEELHSIFKEVNSAKMVFDLRGLFSFKY